MMTPSKGQMLETMKTVCRVWKKEPKTPILIFPDWKSNDYKVMVYEHIGQHSKGDPQGVIQQTRLAKLNEALPLINEYETHYSCKLKLMKRVNISW